MPACYSPFIHSMPSLDRERGTMKLALPKLAKWDFIALVALIVGGALIAANLALVTRKAPGTSIAGGVTAAFVLAQVAMSLVGLFLLGKTAKEGTLWGNLLAVAGLFAGMSGVLLAAALWAAAWVPRGRPPLGRGVGAPAPPGGSRSQDHACPFRLGGTGPIRARWPPLRRTVAGVRALGRESGWVGSGGGHRRLRRGS